MRKSLLAGAAAAIGLMASSAQAAAADARSCLTRAEATNLAVAMLPDLLDAISKKCATALPEAATLRAGLPPLLERYRPAADAAWPKALLVIGKAAGDTLQGIDPKLIRPMIGPMLGDMFGSSIKPADCPQIDRVVTDLAPLPPANIADLAITLVEIGQKSGKKSELVICPTDDKTTASL